MSSWTTLPRAILPRTHLRAALRARHNATSIISQRVAAVMQADKIPDFLTMANKWDWGLQKNFSPHAHSIKRFVSLSFALRRWVTADMYSGGSFPLSPQAHLSMAWAAPLDAISMSAAEVTRRLAAWFSCGGFLVLAAVSSNCNRLLQLWVPYCRRRHRPAH